MVDQNFGINVDLRLQAAGYVYAMREAERATVGLTTTTTALDTTVAAKLTPHLDQLRLMLGGYSREAENAAIQSAKVKAGNDKTADSLIRIAAEANRAKTAMFGYEESVIRSSRAQEAIARSAQSGFGRAASTFARSATSVGAQELVGGAAGRILGPTGGMIAALGIGSVAAPITAAIAAFGGLTLGAYKLLDSFAGLREQSESVQRASANLTAAQTSRSAIEDSIPEIRNRQTAKLGEVKNQQENLAFYEARLVTITKELNEKRAALIEATQTATAAEQRLAALAAGAKGNADATESTQFGLSTQGLSGSGLESAMLGRVRTLASAGRVAQSGGDQDTARAKFQEAIKVIQSLYSALGAPTDRLADFQSAIASLSREIDASYVAAIDDASKKSSTAAAEVATLAASVAALEAASKQASSDIAATQRLLSTAAAEMTGAANALAAAISNLHAAQQAEHVATQAFSDATAADLGIPTEGHSRGLSPPGPTDTVAAMLTPGETVLDRSTSAKLAPILKAAGVRGYADGGYVTLQEGTRRFSDLASAAPSFDRSQSNAAYNDAFNRLVQTLVQTRGINAIDAYRQAGAIISGQGGLNFAAPKSLMSGLGLPGYAGGGKVAAASSQVVKVGAVHINYRSRGGTSADARALAREFKRELSRGSIAPLGR